MSSAEVMAARQPVNILLVDDQPGKLLSYETILAGLGENLIRASSGNEALDHLLRRQIAVVLVDVCMPELDGFELAAMIRNHPRFKKTSIILVSSVLVDDSNRLKGYDSGAVDYVSVPIIPEILRAKVSVFAELFRKTQQLESLNAELEQRVAERTAEIEAAIARLRLVLSTSGTRAWTWNIPRDEVTMVGVSGPDRRIGTIDDLLAFVHPEDRSAVREALAAARDRDTDYQSEFRSVENGETRWILDRGTVLRDAAGQALSIAGIHVDISDRKRAEEERAVLLARTQEAQQEAELANRLKDQFLATLSHELRTPLNAISGWGQMLQAGALDEAGRVRAVDTICRNAQLQSQLISDILDVSRIIAGKLRLTLEDVDVKAVADAALDACRPAAEARDVRLVANIGRKAAKLSADPARLQQIIANLVSNAIKFGAESGRVELKVVAVGPDVEFTVRDDGPGIKPEILPYIFDRFRQADSSSTRAHHGLGLGLAIVRHLVELHGGTVRAENRPDGPGAAFTVRLPRRQRTQTSGVAPPRPLSLAQAPSLKGVRVLVVDDEPDSREMAASILEHCGAETRVAASAAAAISMVRQEPPDVILSDIEMPEEDGYALLRRLRSLPAGQGGDVPVAALTAYASAEDRMKALEAGFQVHVTKPVQPAELAAIVAGLAGVTGKR